mmetsp:Transcript_70291/g.138019  ORF Transcript_70291/g.138019 Transcript_70291/m.138019 type:complete len:141 (-) Transcript_70291:46-468(-)
MEAKQAELQREVDSMLGKIDMERIRPFSKAMYLRMAECYNNKSATTNDIERCLGEVSAPAQLAQSVVQNELGAFQQRLQRCMMECKDEVTDKYRNIDANNQGAAQAMYDKGAVKCADKHLGMMRSLKTNIEQKLDEVLKK